MKRKKNKCEKVLNWCLNEKKMKNEKKNLKIKKKNLYLVFNLNLISFSLYIIINKTFKN